MSTKFLSKLISVAIIFLTQASFGEQIPNELGEPKAVEASADYSVQYGSIRVANDLQRVIVTVPKGSGPHPAFVLIGGLGCYSVDFAGAGPHIDSYKRVIEFMAKNGFVTVRIEKTGMGDSHGQACEEQNFDRELAGYVAGIKALQTYSFVKADRISIFGHSIGGVIAPFLMEQVPVHAAIMMGTLAERWYDYDRSNTVRQLKLAFTPQEQFSVEMEKHDHVAKEFYINKKSPEQILKEYPQGADYLQFPAHYSYMQQLADLDIEASLKKSSAKVFMLLGKGDFIGSQWTETQSFAARINMVREVKVQTENVESLDHFFKNANSWIQSFYNINKGKPLVFQESFLSLLETKFVEMK